MKYQPKSFQKRLLASSISSCMLLSLGATAQENPEMEEVIVTGVRASLQQSMDVKRDSRGVVDAITAEDIGKFPDSNLAESLQRITGVSISRRNGEGSQVTVRGFGPAFNMITLNGRVMPASSLNANGGGDNSSRAFDMDNIASEGVSGVQVYKTSKANIVSGGMGATINLQTRRPFDNPGLNFSVSAKALSDQTNRIGSDVTPEVSLFGSWTDSEERFGVSGSLSVQERDSASSGAFVSQWSGNQAYTGTYPLAINTTEREGPPLQIENEPRATLGEVPGQIVGNPSDLRYFHADRERERTNGQLTFQFRPVDTVTTTLDYTYAKQDLFENRSELSLWFQDFSRTDLVFDDAASPTPVLFWEESRDPLPTVENPNPAPQLARDAGFALQQQNQVNELKSFGLNVEWEATDRLLLNFDLHNSTSESRPDADFGNWINTGIGANISDQQGADWTGELPILMMSFDDTPRDSNGDDVINADDGLNGNGVLDRAEIGSAVRRLNRNTSETEITQFRVDATFELDENASVDFGIEHRAMENLGRTASDQTLLEGGWGIANPGDLPDEFIEPIDYANLFDGYSTNSNNQEWFDEVSDNTARPFTQGIYGDAAKVGRALAEAAGIPFSVSELADTTNRLVEEDITSLYVQLDLETELAGMPFSILAGLRYESTDVKSVSRIAPFDLVWEGNNDFKVEGDQNADLVTLKGTADYNHLLPNLDFALAITDDVTARMSYSSTIARTSYANLSTGATVFGGPSLPTVIESSVPGTAAVGDPNILPLESDNFDLSVEWYYDEGSYASIGYFDKRIDNFVGVEPVPQNVAGILDPSSGPRARAAIAQLAADGIPLDATSLFSMMAAQSRGENFGDRTAIEWENLVDFVGEAGDDLMNFTTQVPRNINDARIEGFEFAVQHFFGDTGFGAIANYTIVNGDVEFDVTQDPQTGAQFALVGLSDTANLTLVYENELFSGRISYNWRDEFLDNTAVTGNEPQFTEEYSQIDFSLSYQPIDNLFVSLDGINITEEDQRQHGRSARQLTRLEILGARYALGVRYTF